MKTASIAKFTCFVEKSTDTTPAGLKAATPHVHRGVQFYEKDRDSIQRLFSHNPIPETGNESDLQEGSWLFERMTNGKYHFFVVSDVDVKTDYKEFDARGILGCGPGSERFS